MYIPKKFKQKDENQPDVNKFGVVKGLIENGDADDLEVSKLVKEQI